MATIALYVTVAWWVPVYLRTLGFFCLTFGTEPDVDKVVATCMRGIKLSTKP